jgi:hypothetical protein
MQQVSALVAIADERGIELAEVSAVSSTFAIAMRIAPTKPAAANQPITRSRIRAQVARALPAWPRLINRAPEEISAAAPTANSTYVESKRRPP